MQIHKLLLIEVYEQFRRIIGPVVVYIANEVPIDGSKKANHDERGYRRRVHARETVAGSRCIQLLQVENSVPDSAFSPQES